MPLFPRAPLARRLSLAVGFIVSVLALALGLFLGLQSGRTERRTVSEGLETTTRTLASGVDPADLDSVLDEPDETAPPLSSGSGADASRLRSLLA